jgi:A/G-specific adenine glycosylase
VRELLGWYAREKRQLPWREHPDPYAVWVSEIMLQQTRVETVIPYFERWLKRFPSVHALAEASLKEVLSTWEGLGYYSRARNMHRTSKILVQEYHGELPADLHHLRRLPGIGRYTAGAIASIAFGSDEPVLDGNIRRVLARFHDIQVPLRSPGMEEKLWQLAAENLPPGQAGDYNQALMELGATICTPRSPECPRCPLQAQCKARLTGVQEQRPVKVKKPTIPHHTVTAAVIRRQGKLLIVQRPLDGLLGGLWEFPGGKIQPGESLPQCLKREIREELDVQIEVQESLGVFNHAYTHFRVTLHAFHCTLHNGIEPRPIEAHDLRWVEPAELCQFPMGKIDRMISQQLADCLPGD